MIGNFPYSAFIKNFSTNDTCLEKIVQLKYPNGIVCNNCQRITKHYRVRRRLVYACKFCRTQIYPLVDTLFEKSSTQLTLWLLALYLMTQTRGEISIKTIKEELNVTYKTAWRIKSNIYKLMQKNKGDLLKDTSVSKWVIFNAIELKVVRKA